MKIWRKYNHSDVKEVNEIATDNWRWEDAHYDGAKMLYHAYHWEPVVEERWVPARLSAVMRDRICVEGIDKNIVLPDGVRVKWCNDGGSVSFERRVP